MTEPPRRIVFPALVRRKTSTFSTINVNPQGWLSIPRVLLLYMINNPNSPEIWLKFIQACKLPFSMRKIIPVGYLKIEDHRSLIGMEEDALKTRIGFAKKTSCMLWPYDLFVLWNSKVDSNALVSHIYRSDIKDLRIVGNVLANVFSKLTSSGSLKVLRITGDIINPDGDSASVDQIFANVENLEQLWWNVSKNSSLKTAEDVKKFLQNMEKLESLLLEGIPEKLFPVFAEFFKENKATDIHLYFWEEKEAITESYKQLIEDFMNEAIQNSLEKPPKIPFAKFVDEDLLMKYNELQHP